MSIPESSQTADKVLDGLVAACCTIYNASLDASMGEYAGTWNDGTTDWQVVVVEAMPGEYMPDIIVAVGSDVRQTVSRPTMGTNRSREIDVEVDLVLSVAIAGNATAARTARVIANHVAESLALHFRQAGQETLGGACRDSWLSRLAGPKITLAENEAGVWGRVAEITATVTATVRN